MRGAVLLSRADQRSERDDNKMKMETAALSAADQSDCHSRLPLLTEGDEEQRSVLERSTSAGSTNFGSNAPATNSRLKVSDSLETHTHSTVTSNTSLVVVLSR